MGSREGFRLVRHLTHYRKNKRRYPAFTDPTIREVNICEYHPCELPGLSYIQPDEPVWYFFCTLHNKYAKGDLVNRTAKGGSWKKTGKDIVVKAIDSDKKIGIKKTLVFYEGRNTQKENKTNWIMHEYHEYPCNKDPLFKGEVVVCRIERKRKPSSAPLDEGQPSDSDAGNNVAQDILELEYQPPQNLHLPSSSNSIVANNILMGVESQPIPNQHISSHGEDHVARYIFPELESQLLPNQHVSSITGDHVAKAILSQLESQSPLPNYHASSTIEHHTINNSFSELEPQLLPNHHVSSNFEDYVDRSMFFEVESQLLPNHHLSSDIETHAEKDIFSELPPLVPPLWDELGDCNGPYHNSFSTLPLPMYPMPGSPYYSCFSNDSAQWLDHNSLSTLQSLMYPMPPMPGSPYSSYFSNDSAQDHNSFSTLLSPIYPMPGSPYSSCFSNDSAQWLDPNTFPALQFPIYLQPGWSYSSGFSDGSNAQNPQFSAEQEYDLANSYWSVQDDFSSPGTGITFPPDFNPSKAVSGGCVGNGSDAVMEIASAWPNGY